MSLTFKFSRIKWLAVLVAVLLFSTWGIAYAADRVGLVDSQAVMFQHPRFDDAARLLLLLSRPLEGSAAQLLINESNPERRELITRHSTQVSAFAELDRAIAAENDQERRNTLRQDRQRRLSELEASLMGPILDECGRAMQAVMTLRNMTVLIEFDSVYYGGTDITEEVIQQLRRQVR